MFEIINSLDRTLFYFINVNLANPVTDFIMPLITSNDLLRISYAAAMLLILWRGDARLRWIVIFSALVIIGTDQIVASLLKPWIGRIRPCHSLEGINLLVVCGSGKAMPSAHAANAFGQALLFGLLEKRFLYPLIIIASIIALSRVFVGVHYPGDIIVGSLIGAFIGTIMAMIFRRYSLHLP